MLHPPSSSNDDSIPWVDELDQHAHAAQISETLGEFDDDANDFELNDGLELDTHITKFTNVAAICTQPITALKKRRMDRGAMPGGKLQCSHQQHKSNV